MLKITSRDNKRLKNVRHIRDGRNKNFIFIEGIRLTKEALRSNLKFSEVFISENFSASQQNAEFLEKILAIKAETFLIPDATFKTISDTKSPQGLILISKTPVNNKTLLEEKLRRIDSQNSLILLLNEINNPSNLGAILRTAEAAGLSGIITTKSSANVFSSKANRSAMGANFRLPIWENADFDKAIEWAKSVKMTSICADINATKSYLETDWNRNIMLVFGSEAHGLNKIDRNKIDECVFIPMANNVESLNLAVSCGIVLFEAKKGSSTFS